MLIQSNKFIPEVYAKERDMQVFTTLIDIILTCCKYDIDALYRLYNAMECSQDLLEYLGDTVNYKYDGASTVTANRKIIDTFMFMMKYKGSEIGLKMATALCLTSLDISKDKLEILEMADINSDYYTALSNIQVKYDYENARIIIDYPNTLTQVRYLIDYVRPVGMLIDFRSVVNIGTHIPMAILAQASHHVHEYNMKQSEINNDKINYSEPYPYPKNSKDSDPIENNKAQWVKMILSDDDYKEWVNSLANEDNIINLND